MYSASIKKKTYVEKKKNNEFSQTQLSVFSRAHELWWREFAANFETVSRNSRDKWRVDYILAWRLKTFSIYIYMYIIYTYILLHIPSFVPFVLASCYSVTKLNYDRLYAMDVGYTLRFTEKYYFASLYLRLPLLVYSLAQFSSQSWYANSIYIYICV